MRSGPTRVQRWDRRHAVVLAASVITAAAVVAAIGADGDPPAVRLVQPATSALPPVTVAGDAGRAQARLPVADEPARVVLRRLVRRHRAAPLLGVHASHAGRMALRWSSGRRRGARVVRVVGPGMRRIALTGLPSRWTRPVRVSATLRPSEHGGRAPAHARHVYGIAAGR